MTVGTPASIVGRTELVRSWYRTEKLAFTARLVQLIDASSSNTDAALSLLLKRLERTTAIRFTSADLSRLGNVDIVEPLTGDYSTLSLFDGPRLTQAGASWHLEFRLTNVPERNEVDQLCVRVRGGAADKDGAIIHDALHRPPPDSRVVLEITEPPGWYEIMAYDNSGHLLDSQAGGFYRQITGAVADNRGVTEALPQTLRNELATPFRSAPSPVYSEPWIQSELEAASLQRHLFPALDPDFHAFYSPAEHRAFVAEFLLTKELIVIADPYFDVGVLRDYFRRDRGRLTGDITVVVSYARGHKTLSNIATFCASQADRLPDRLRILNLVPPPGVRNAFHDRFVVVGSGFAKQTWHLGSSINSYSQRYPLFAVRVRGKARDVWADYVDGLARGDLGTGRSITPEPVFEQLTAPPWRLIQPMIIASDTRRIPYWATLLDLLAPRQMRRPWDRLCPPRIRAMARKRRSADAIVTLLKRGIIVEDIGQYRGWRKGPRVTSRLLNKLVAASRRNERVLDALAVWNANNGATATQYPFTRADVVRIAARLQAEARLPWSGNKQSQLPRIASDASFEEILAHYSRSMDHLTMTADGFRNKWLQPFLRDVCLSHWPDQFFDVIGSARSQRLYDVAFALRSSELAQTYEGAIKHQTPGVVAVALLILHERAGSQGVVPQRSMTSLDTFEYAAARVILAYRATDDQSYADLFDDVMIDERHLSRIKTLMKFLPISYESFLAALAERRSDGEAERLRNAVVTTFESTLPLKHRWNGRNLSEEHRDSDPTWPALVARQLAASPNGNIRCESILKALDVGAACSPFLRMRNFGLWQSLWTRIVMALCFGLEMRTFSTDAEPLARDLARLLRCLQPEVLRMIGESTMLLHCLDLAAALDDPSIDVALKTLTAANEAQRAAMGQKAP